MGIFDRFKQNPDGVEGFKAVDDNKEPPVVEQEDATDTAVEAEVPEVEKPEENL